MDSAIGTGGGLLVVVVGPSGAGKDTLMDAARRHFERREDIHFVRRFITRPAEAGGEVHEAVSPGDFERMAAAGGFAVWWEAHGLKYGVPAAVCAELGEGRLAIVNGSRSALAAFARVFPRLRVVSVTARPDVLAERLAARGRESREDILNRLARAPTEIGGGFDVTEVDNSARLEDAVNVFLGVLEKAAADRLVVCL